MVLAEAPQLYPVYTSHIDDLRTAAEYVFRRMEKHAGKTGAPDEWFFYLMHVHNRLIKMIWLLQSADSPIAYLKKDDRELVRRIDTWVKGRPEAQGHNDR